ncbi:MAG: glycosyltransferase family 4 protein [Clostridiales bacterium]|nr:glycosyltransferase family 4 protein [Clostridiales bacterium]
MNILVVCQHYYPEPLRITDICESLVEQGNSVTVVTATPNYPMGKIYAGYEKRQRADEILNGVKVHRCPVIPRKTGVFFRVLNYISFPVSSQKYINSLDAEYDVVFVNQLSPAMMAKAGIRYKKKHHKKMVLYCLDLWPESLCVGGIRKNSPVYKLFKRISGNIYRAADDILVTSRSFHKYLMDMFDIPEDRIAYLPQYAEDLFLNLDKKEQTNQFNLLFAGNIGAAQNLETIISAAALLRDRNVLFHIVGDGSELKNIKEKAAGLQNVKFYGRKPLEEMPEYYEMADAMLITLIDDPIISLTLPGKIQTYMAAGKAIVGAANGETALVLTESQGGYCGASGDGQALAENIRELMDSGKAEEIGKKNREYYLQTFSKTRFMEKLTEMLQNNIL